MGWLVSTNRRVLTCACFEEEKNTLYTDNRRDTTVCTFNSIQFNSIHFISFHFILIQAFITESVYSRRMRESLVYTSLLAESCTGNDSLLTHIKPSQCELRCNC
jgi:hypothetical protein